jgi:hypothetical protein
MSRLVISTISDTDVESIEKIMQDMGHNARAGAVRYALRLLLRAEMDSPEVMNLVAKVRRESCLDAPEHKAFLKVRRRLPVNLSPDDSDIMEELKDRYELDSFAQVVRLALRHADLLD